MHAVRSFGAQPLSHLGDHTLPEPTDVRQAASCTEGGGPLDRLGEWPNARPRRAAHSSCPPLGPVAGSIARLDHWMDSALALRS